MEHPLTKQRLLEEISGRAPWYQRIAFPEFGVTTTDHDDWLVKDQAWDNLFPGVDPAQAARLRPLPKYERIARFLPNVTGKSVLEVGCSCGFFAMTFAQMGAIHVTGIDVDARNVSNATFAASVLGISNATFLLSDLGTYTQAHDVVWGSSIHEHFFFPFAYLARMLCIARDRLVLETHHYKSDDDATVARLDSDYALGSHAFHLSRQMYLRYLSMLGVRPYDIQEDVFYEDATVRRLLLGVDTGHFQTVRRAHPFLRPLSQVGVL